MPIPQISELQALVDGPLRYAARGREACANGDWLAFQLEPRVSGTSAVDIAAFEEMEITIDDEGEFLSRAEFLRR